MLTLTVGTVVIEPPSDPATGARVDRARRARDDARAYLDRRRAQLLDDVSRRWSREWGDEEVAG